jgi:RHS repeat-associated protein
VDDGTGLYYARARYWSPQLGRFFTKDIAAGKDNDGQTLNRFVYSLNNPLLFRDVNGFCSIKGDFLTTLNFSLHNLIVPEQFEVLATTTANSTSMTYSGPNISGAVLVNAVGLVTLFIPGAEEVGGAIFLDEVGTFSY